MRTLKSGLVATVVTIGLLASSAVVAAAQDDGVEATASAFFSWTVGDQDEQVITLAASSQRLANDGGYEGLTLVLATSAEGSWGWIVPSTSVPPTPKPPAE